MPEKIVTNPAGAFGLSAAEHYQRAIPMKSGEASTTIAAKDVVSIHTDGTVLLASTSIEPRLCIGIALEEILAGKTGLVCIEGYVDDVGATGAIAAGGLVQRDTTTAGNVLALTSGATEIGDAVGFAISAAAGNLVDLWVYKV